MKSKKYSYSLLVLLASLGLIMWNMPAMAADPGVFPDRIIVGAPSDLSGPTAFAGKVGTTAVKAYFAKAYEEKIYPRKIELIVEDGGYAPATIIKAAKLLLERDKVFCFTVSCGTSSTLALNAILEEEKTPIVGNYTHAESVAIPPKKYMFQMFTTYLDEAKIAVDYIVEKQGKNVTIAYLYQDDEMGYDGLKGFQDQMKKYGITPVLEISHKRGAIDLSSQALKLKSANPDWVIQLSLWTEASKIIKEARKIGWDPQFLLIGPGVDENIFKLAGDAMDVGKPVMGLNVSYLWDGDSWGAKEYRETLKKYMPGAEPGTFSIWAYGFAKILVEGLKRIEGEPTREKLVQALETFKGFETGVFPPLTWGPNLRKGSQGGMIIIKKEKAPAFVPVTGWRYVK